MRSSDAFRCRLHDCPRSSVPCSRASGDLREEPGAGKPHARICEGEAEWPSYSTIAQAAVLNDNTVRLGGLVLDIPPGPRNRSCAKARVDVRQHLDGSWSVYYQDRRIAQAERTALREPAKARIKTRRRTPAKGADEILWRYLPPDGLTPQKIFHHEAAP